MKKFLTTYWPLLAGVLGAVAYYLLSDGRRNLTALLTPGIPYAQAQKNIDASRAAVAASPRQGVVSIDANDVTMTVLPDTVPVIPRVMSPMAADAQASVVEGTPIVVLPARLSV